MDAAAGAVGGNMIFVKNIDGTYSELPPALPRETTVTFQDDLGALYEDEYPNVALSGGAVELSLDLNRESRKAWARIFQMQRYKATEWIFPRKKKRGTARKRRRENRL